MGQLVFLFPGQGAQVVGMGRDFYERFPEARKVYDLADDVLGFSLTKVCFEGPQESLNSTSICQPAILTTSIAMLRAMEAVGHPALSACGAAAGLSLGEYSALVMAGALEFEAAVRLVRKRGEFMEEACNANPGGMISVLGLPDEEVEAICREASSEGIVTAANFNCPGQVVISGVKQALARAAELAKLRGAKRVIPLQVNGAFHSPLMAMAAAKLEPELMRTDIFRARFPVVANATAQPVQEPGEIRSALASQVCSPVRWRASMELLRKQGFDTFYEVGPGQVLTGLMRRIDKEAKIRNISSLKELEETSISA